MAVWTYCTTFSTCLSPLTTVTNNCIVGRLALWFCNSLQSRRPKRSPFYLHKSRTEKHSAQIRRLKLITWTIDLTGRLLLAVCSIQCWITLGPCYSVSSQPLGKQERPPWLNHRWRVRPHFSMHWTRNCLHLGNQFTYTGVCNLAACLSAFAYESTT